MRFTGRESREALVLVAAAALALVPPTAAVLERPWRERSTLVVQVEAMLAPSRPLWRPGERVAVLVPRADDAAEQAFAYCAQYALAPAVVEPVVLRACTGEVPGGCEMRRARRLAVVENDPEGIEAARRRLGVRPAGGAGAVLLMVREP